MGVQAGKVARRVFIEDDFNCSEAAWLGVAHDLNREEQHFGCRLAGGFGGGAACGDICGGLAGAIVGMGYYLGRVPGQPRPEQLRSATEELNGDFVRQFGSVNCRDIRLQSDDFRNRCADYVEFAAARASELIDAALEEDLDCG